MIRLPVNSRYNFYASASSYLGNITPLLSSFTPTYSHSLLLTPHFSHLLSSVPLPPSYFHILTLITTHYRFLQLNITHSHLTLFISVFFPLKSATLNYWKVFFFTDSHVNLSIFIRYSHLLGPSHLHSLASSYTLHSSALRRLRSPRLQTDAGKNSE